VLVKSENVRSRPTPLSQPAAMESATLDDFMSLNDQVAAAIDAGVPLDVDLGADKQTAAAKLEKINALVARRVSQGSSLSAAIATPDPAITPGYRCMMQLGLATGDFSRGMDLSNRLGRTIARVWDAGWMALLYPAIVCGMAFVGLVGFCLFFVPILESTHRGLAIPAGSGLKLLMTLRDSLPIWGWAVPLGLFVIGCWGRRRSRNSSSSSRRGFVSSISGVSRTVLLERAANFAEATAELLNIGVPLDDDLGQAADIWNDPALAETTRKLAARLSQGETNVGDSTLAANFPPFLRWSLLHSEGTIGRVRALQTAAELYRWEAKRRQERLRVLAPLVMAVVIGGSATLLYGLALFIPVVEMLRALAS